jgi:NTE family protein
MRAWRVTGRTTLLALVLAGCASIHNEPVNQPLTPGLALAHADAQRGDPTYADNILLGLAFSGGGTRAAAFSHGVLAEMDRVHVPAERGENVPLLDRIDFVSGVSGGSVTAAYFGLKKRAALADFRERFLLQDAESSLRTRVSLINVSRALSGGINDSDHLPRWLDENLFQGATLSEFRATRRPRIWINASDIYNRTTFVFGSTAFNAICSDLGSYPIASAVAASAAVPVLFAPVVLKGYPQQCPYQLPEWIVRARANPATPPMLKAFADAVARYHDGSMPYIKLLDGGLVDNFGLSGFTIARLSSETPYGPLSPQQAVKLRRALFIVVDAGRGPSGNWVQSVEGPGAADLVMAAADTAIDASVRASFTAFESTMRDWQQQLVRWRCGLTSDQRLQFGASANWACGDIKFQVTRISFDQLGPARSAELNAVPTRFKLPAEQVDLLIAAGGDALQANAEFRDFVGAMRGGRGRAFTDVARARP